MAALILVVDDEEDIVELLNISLKREGYSVISADNGEKAIALTRSSKPDLIVLDLMLPGIDGLEVCKTLKSNQESSSIPVIMLTAKGEESDVVTGLEIGAEDYITKPFSPKILVARIRRILKRISYVPDDDSTIRIHSLVIDPQRHTVTSNGKPVQLTLTEFNILRFLARRPGRVFTRYQIVDAVRGQDCAVTDRAVDVQIVALRKKLGPQGKCIETVRGVGYRFKDNS